MTDKELIKQEIEYRLSSGKYSINSKQALEDIIVFIDSLPEEPASEDLEEAAEVFYNNCNIAKPSWWDEGILHKMSESKETFIAGAEWQKQQMKEALQTEYKKGRFDMREEMMKDAVNAVVHQGLYSKYVKECDNEALANVLKNYNSGDKVKIIIVKEEQQ